MSNSKVKVIIDTLLNEQNEVDWQSVLESVLHAFECSTGSIHLLDSSSNLLNIVAAKGIPESLLPKMSAIPVGKGMAGITAERREPVEICNLQTDDSGVVRPSAKETKVEGSIAIPMLLDDVLFGVFGVAKPVSYDFTQEEMDVLMKIGEAMSKRIKSGQEK